MKVIIAGCGIGGLTTALTLHRAGFDVELFEQAPAIRELGVGINLLPHAVKELTELGLLEELDRAGVRTKRLILMNRFGQIVWDEPRGIDAGYEFPQISIHRGTLQGILYRAVIDRIGADRIHTGHRLARFNERGNEVIAQFERWEVGDTLEITGDALIGADGIHSTVRASTYPYEGAPTWNGIMLWRGATDWPVYADGQTMLIAGGNNAKIVVYPIRVDPSRPDQRLTNWGIMARFSDGSQPPPRREDWSRPGQRSEALAFVRDMFHLDFIDPEALIAATEVFYEYPCCDRDPVPHWTFGRTTLLGDAAHPMYPVGSNGASQAILDAQSLAECLMASASVTEALAAYEAKRRPVTTEIVKTNRRGGPEGVIDLVEALAPDGFDDLDAVVSYAEREAIVRGYASMAGFAVEQVNRR